MNQIEFRQVTRADYAKLETLIRKTWGSKASYPAPIKRVLRKINLYHYLSEQNYNRLAIWQGEIVGIILGRSEHLPYLPGKLRHLAPLLWNKAKLLACPNGRAHFAQPSGRSPGRPGAAALCKKRVRWRAGSIHYRPQHAAAWHWQRASAAVLSIHAAKRLPEYLSFYGYQL